MSILKLATSVCVLAFAVAFPLRAQEGPGEGAPMLRSGDLLRVQIWREPDLSGEFLIDEDGNVTLPLLGVLPAAGIPVDDLIDDLIETYRTQIRNPSITIVPLRQVFLLGDVMRPGLYTVPPATTLAGAVALAGGANPIGDLNKISVVRDGERIHPRVAMDRAIFVADIRSGDQIYVGRIHWVKRNATYLIGVGFTLFGLVMQFI